MMQQKLFTLSFFLLLCTASVAQNKLLDSIRGEIEKHPARDTTRVRLIMDYVQQAVNENTTMLQPYLNEMINISKERNYLAGVSAGYITAQLYYSDRGDFATSILYADSAFIYLKQDTSKRALINSAYLHSNLGGDYLKMGDYQQSIDHFTQAAGIMEKHKPEYVGSAYTGLAEVYEHLLQPEKAMEYDRKAIAAAEKAGNKIPIARRYLNYIVRLINQRQFDKADELLRKIGPTVTETQDAFSLVLFHQNKGFVYQNRKDHAAAVSNFKLAHHYARSSEDVYQEITILDPLARGLMDAGHMEEAKLFLDTLLQKSKTHQMHFGELNAYADLARWYAAKGDHKTANEFLNRKQILSDSVSSADMKEKIAMTETRFKVQGKDNEIKILQTEKQNHELRLRQKDVLNYILIGSAAALLIISSLFYRNYRQRISELETEKQLTATEAVLKGEEQERTRLAKDLHDGLGGMLSGIKHSFTTVKGNLVLTPENQQAFERSLDMLDSSINEMRRVAHNMMPEVLVKYGLDTALQDLCIDIHQNGILKINYQSIGMEEVTIDQTTAITLFRIAQELLNNAIRHAAATSVIVQLTKTDGRLSLTVEDDGKGFDMAVLKQTSGIGWRNIQNRVEFLKGRLDVRSSPGNGSSVLVEVDV